MTPVKFPECNTVFGPPQDLEESQCRSIDAWMGNIKTGSCDGLRQIVVAYQLEDWEKEHLLNGGVLFLSMIGGLAPHFHSFSFQQAIHPA